MTDRLAFVRLDGTAEVAHGHNRHSYGIHRTETGHWFAVHGDAGRIRLIATGLATRTEARQACEEHHQRQR